jgi:phosphate transport system ATP-binding protein
METPVDAGTPVNAATPVKAGTTVKAETPAAAETPVKAGMPVKADNVSAWYGKKLAIRNVAVEMKPNKVTAFIGPSGCGKSTFLRTINRMHEVIPGGRVGGDMWVGEQNVYDSGADPVKVRAEIGMVFQRPNPFPTMSIYDNVASGPKLTGRIRRGKDLTALVENSLKRAALWDEVKNRLREPATGLSGGQQQRLCIARALAMEPGVILLDEPTSALDPIASYKIEELMNDLKTEFTVVIVTHNMQQAARIADFTAFMLAGDDYVGELVEYGKTSEIFSKPRDKRTEDYITGRFG